MLIVEQKDVVLLAANVATDVVDGWFAVFVLLNQNCFQKFCIAVTLILVLFSHHRSLLALL